MLSVSRLTACLAVPVACALAASAPAAQSATPPASMPVTLTSLVGTELRARTTHTLVQGKLLLVLKPDTMLLQSNKGDTLIQVPMPLQCVRAIEQFDGHYSSGHSALHDGIVGVLVGGTVAFAARLIAQNHGDELGHVTHLGNAATAVVGIALISGGIGAIIGSHRHVVRWRPIPVPSLSPESISQGDACTSLAF